MVVDLRSDTVTRPCARMREAMSSAAVGDDVRGDDPTVSGLQRRVAGTLGKEAGLFLPSGRVKQNFSAISLCPIFLFFERMRKKMVKMCKKIAENVQSIVKTCRNDNNAEKGNDAEKNPYRILATLAAISHRRRHHG